MTLVLEFFEAFEEGVEFRTREVAVGGIDERGVATDLAQAQEAREDVEADGGEGGIGVHAHQLRTGAFELGVVEAALLAFEFDDDFIFRAGGQVGGGFGLGPA